MDAVYSALNSMGFKNVEIVVAETGWPFKGDDTDVGPSIENAKAYNGNLIAHLRSMVGTPLMPGKSVDTYLLALYDEDLKPGPGSERSFGLFKTDLTMVYDVGRSKTSQVRTKFMCISFHFTGSIPELSFDLAFKFLFVLLGTWFLKHHYAFCLLIEWTVPFQERKKKQPITSF